MKSSNGVTVVFAIVAIAALALSGYMFVSYEILGTQGSQITTEEEATTLVALWEDISKNKEIIGYNTDSQFLLEYDDNKILNPNYIDSNSSIRFGLIKPGYYKITLNVLLDNMDIGEVYYVQLLENNDYGEVFDFYNCNATGYHHVKASVIVHSDGTDIFQIRAGASYGDAFFLLPQPDIYNFLSIEYILT